MDIHTQWLSREVRVYVLGIQGSGIQETTDIIKNAKVMYQPEAKSLLIENSSYKLVPCT